MSEASPLCTPPPSLWPPISLNDKASSSSPRHPRINFDSFLLILWGRGLKWRGQGTQWQVGVMFVMSLDSLAAGICLQVLWPMQGEWQKQWPGEPAAIFTEALLCSQPSKDLSLFFHIKQALPLPHLCLWSLSSLTQVLALVGKKVRMRPNLLITNGMIELILWGQAQRIH